VAFSDEIRLDKKGREFVRFSIRVSEKKVEEYFFRVGVFKGIFTQRNKNWNPNSSPSTIIKSKRTKSGILIKIRTSEIKSDVYELSKSQFELLRSLFLSEFGE
tara:strand:- start:128 stop:436 length:309 start_codon:yes stop_codon:yes gene_type:complete